MSHDNLRDRTKKFAIAVLNFIEKLPNTIKGRAVAGQLVRAGTSVGANYRAACRSRSKAEFIARIGVVIEEADESAYWLELIIEAGLVNHGEVHHLLDEANQIVAIMTQSKKTAELSKTRHVSPDSLNPTLLTRHS